MKEKESIFENEDEEKKKNENKKYQDNKV